MARPGSEPAWSENAGTLIHDSPAIQAAPLPCEPLGGQCQVRASPAPGNYVPWLGDPRSRRSDALIVG
jgi:hypothetical protein